MPAPFVSGNDCSGWAPEGNSSRLSRDIEDVGLSSRVVLGVSSCPVSSRSWKLRDESPLLNGTKDRVFLFSSFECEGTGGTTLFLLPITVPSRFRPPSLPFSLCGVLSGTTSC